MIVTLSDRAKVDLVGIGEYIAMDDPVRAATFVGELLTACDGLAEFPRAYPSTRASVPRSGGADMAII